MVQILMTWKLIVQRGILAGAVGQVFVNADLGKGGLFNRVGLRPSWQIRIASPVQPHRLMPTSARVGRVSFSGSAWDPLNFLPFIPLFNPTV